MTRRKYYVVTYVHDDLTGWTKYLLAHVRYLKRQVKKGKIIVSGPSEGDHRRQAILIFAVENQEELTALIHEDPYYQHNLIIEMTITPWKPQFGNLN